MAERGLTSVSAVAFAVGYTTVTLRKYLPTLSIAQSHNFPGEDGWCRCH